MLSKEIQQLLSVFDSYNVDRITNYHNEIKRLFHNEICYINKKLNDCSISEANKIELKSKKESYQNDYYPQMIITNFLMIFSYLEEYMFLIRNRYPENSILKKRNGSIGRFINTIESIGKELTKTNEWNFFIQSEIVRNCLLHANGRIDIVKTGKDNQKLQNIVKNSKGLLSIESNRIRLSSNYLSEFVNNIKKFQKLLKTSNAN